jgi:FtsP/CotA-like multicopper oxidase with cupredoxin domain
VGAELSRRQALQVAALGASGVVAGGVGTWRTFLAPAAGSFGTRAGEALRQLPVISSRNGVLDVRLTAARGVDVAGRKTGASGYNGTLPGPTLRIRPGDRVRLNLVNRLDDATNLHTHGLHVSPEGNGDNIFRRVEAGETARYEYAIPADHPSGTFWYHPHLHGSVADQIFSGLYGAIVISAEDEPEEVRERVLFVSDITLTSGGDVARVSRAQVMAGREGDTVLVNGQALPRIDLTAGQAERWRVVNACTSRLLVIQLEGHTLGLLGYDGQSLGQAVDRQSVLLAPGNRADLVVEPSRSGTFALRTLAVDRGGMGMMSGGPGGASPEVDLAIVEVSAHLTSGAPSPRPSPSRSRQPRDLRGALVDHRRTITFTMGMGMGMRRGDMSFGFDGREFDHSRVDQQLSLGTVEEWTIANATPMDHPFHLHVWPMQVIEAPYLDPNGAPDWRDVVIVPARGQVRIRVPVVDFGGRTVYHCHILDHEDQGMMAIVEAGR